MNILQILQDEFKITKTQLENTITLIDEDNTIPFIARYRKELTGSLDDQVLRELNDRLLYLRNLEAKKEQVLKSITEQEKLTEEIEKSLELALTLTEVEDIYRPFKPKRRTRATIAKEKGLDPLADIIIAQTTKDNIMTLAAEYISEEKGVLTEEDAINGAKDIVAEMISDNALYRKLIRNLTFDSGVIESKATDAEAESVFLMYYDYCEPVKSIVGHRILAVNRGEKEKFLSVKIQISQDEVVALISKNVIIKGSTTADILRDVIEDSYKRLIAPSIEREIRNELTEDAEEKGMKVFAVNLKQLLLQPPIKDKVVLALDPGFRTGCKIAVVDETGKTLDTSVVYPTPPKSKIEESKKILMGLIKKHDVDIIAIGNGTASRESENFVCDMLKEIDKKIYYVIVNEAGASIYSASKLGALEFPEFDVALRSAVSIGRRLQDPLAELVKIDPQSIGVGQYQHDMNQKRLGETLGGVVENCVNSVGVDLNTASPSLLSYISGISSAVANNILKYREENGKFKTRKELLKVAKLGPKAFLQCAGFLRITESDNILDNTGVHPESYDKALMLLSELNLNVADIKEKQLKVVVNDMEDMAKKLEIGVPTLEDIIKELEKPGRDLRAEMPAPILRSDVLEIEDIEKGMVLKGTVRNVIDFGAFVDIGVHQDALVHISQICDKFIKHPLEVLNVGDVITVKVLDVDVPKKRISLTMLI